MAAIIPHLEHRAEATPLETQFWRCTGGEQQLEGAFGDGTACPNPHLILRKNHMELLAMVYVRNAVEQSLQDRTFIVQSGKPQIDPKGGPDKLIDKNNVYLVLDGPIGEGPPWNPAATPSARAYNLLTWTSKMNAPSWSIPAGAPEIGGSCPGATAGQTVVPEATLVRAARPIEEVTGEKVDLARSICNYCYATGGQYATGGVQFAQALRHIWVRQAIMEPTMGPFGPSTLFIETMVSAISTANFYLDGGATKAGEDGVATQKLPPEHSRGKFFRIHDSGDFFSPEYFTQWKAVADRLPDVQFWSPSRVWALGRKWIDHVNKVNAEPRNFTVRPSAYHIDGPCPANLGPGWASGSTVYSKNAPVQGVEYEWQCDAYATGSHHQCRGAKAPPGLGNAEGRGCRACWVAPQLRVNYNPH